MITTRPEVALTSRYPIGAAAEALGIDRHTLQRKIKDGTIKCKFRRDNLRKVILGSEIIRYWESSF